MFFQALIQPDLSTPRPEESLADAYELTPREQEVWALLVEGMTNPEIADRLVISRSTAKAHVSSILSKIGVSNRAEAIALALQYHPPTGD